MFRDDEEVLYADSCCHFNSEGYDFLVDAIVGAIRADID